MSVIVKGIEMPKNCGHCRLAGVCGCHSAEEWPDIESIVFNDVIGVYGERDAGCPLVEAPEWISVEERLPEGKELVLCYTPVDGYMFVGYHFSYKWGSDAVSKWRIITSMRSTKDITKKVTHWMPLPEPPKDGEP